MSGVSGEFFCHRCHSYKKESLLARRRTNAKGHVRYVCKSCDENVAREGRRKRHSEGSRKKNYLSGKSFSHPTYW